VAKYFRGSFEDSYFPVDLLISEWRNGWILGACGGAKQARVNRAVWYSSATGLSSLDHSDAIKQALRYTYILYRRFQLRLHLCRYTKLFGPHIS